MCLFICAAVALVACAAGLSVGAGSGTAGGSSRGGTQEEGVYLQLDSIQNPATREHFLPPPRFLPGCISLWFSWGGRKEAETASYSWGSATVRGMAELPWHVLCPRRWEQAAPSPLPALGAGDSRGSLPCVSGLGDLRDGWMGSLGELCGVWDGAVPVAGDAFSREAFWSWSCLGLALEPL